MIWIRSSVFLSLLVAGVLTFAAQERPQVRLRETAEVHGQTIRLSDLLPADASLELREVAAAVELGRAPQAGSERILTAAQIAQRLAGDPSLVRQIAIPARMSIRRTAWPLRREAVQSAVLDFLRARGWPAHELPPADALEWPQGVLALSERPALEMTGASWDGSRQALELRLRCVNRALCSSFLVLMHASQPLLAGRDQPSGATASAPQRARGRAAEPMLAKPGEKAMLVLERAGMRISFPVICLERGALRQQIRVREAGGQRVFHAEVMSAGWLRATF